MDRFSFIALLLSLVVEASAQNSGQKPLPKDALEKYDDPPALLRRLQFSPGMVSQFSTFTSRQVNVNASGQNTVGDAANEPSISVDPTNGNKMAIGWRQFNSVSSNFRQAGRAYTVNGGATWTFPGVLENNVFRSDPVLDSDNTGRFFYLSLLQTFYDNMWRSINGGQTWANLGPATGGDKQWFTIDNTASVGHGFQYQSWSTGGNNYGGRQFSRSTDGGFSWLNPIFIPNSPSWGTLDVDSSGNVFVGGINLNTNQIWCVRSSNAKNGGVIPSFDQSTAVNMGGNINYSGAINPGGLVGQIFLAIDRSGTATNNYVYMLASVQPTGTANGSDVMFVRSMNGGQTFSAPVRVNNDPINHAKWHWFGTLSVAPNGRIDSVWLDSRNAANNTDSQLFYSYSTNGGTTWAPNVAVSNSFNPFLGYPNQNKMGDYITIVSDNTGGNVAYTATFNGGEDIYYVRVSPPVALKPPTDFNNDGKPDYVLFNAGSRRTAVWYLNNAAFLGGVYGPILPSGWTLIDAADFNRNGQRDFVLFNAANRRTSIWYLSGVTFVASAFGPAVPANWQVVTARDFNADSQPDFVLYNTSTRQTAVWYLNNNAFVRGAFGPTLSPDWSLVGVADFDRDGQLDYLLFNPSTRQSIIWYLFETTFLRAAAGPVISSGYILQGTEDFNADRYPDYILYNPALHRTAIWYLHNNVYVAAATGPILPSGWSLVAP